MATKIEHAARTARKRTATVAVLLICRRRLRSESDGVPGASLRRRPWAIPEPVSDMPEACIGRANAQQNLVSRGLLPRLCRSLRPAWITPVYLVEEIVELGRLDLHSLAGFDRSSERSRSGQPGRAYAAACPFRPARMQNCLRSRVRHSGTVSDRWSGASGRRHATVRLAMPLMTFFDHPDLVRITPVPPPWRVFGGQDLHLRCERQVDHDVALVIAANARSDGPCRMLTAQTSVKRHLRSWPGPVNWQRPYWGGHGRDLLLFHSAVIFAPAVELEIY